MKKGCEKYVLANSNKKNVKVSKSTMKRNFRIKALNNQLRFLGISKGNFEALYFIKMRIKKKEQINQKKGNYKDNGKNKVENTGENQ